MQRPTSKFTKASWLRLALSVQLLLSGSVMPAMAADLDSAIKSGSAEDAANAVSRLIADTTENRGDAAPAPKTVETVAPSWVDDANKFLESENHALSNSAAATTTEKTEAVSTEKAPSDTAADSNAKPANADPAKATDGESTNTSSLKDDAKADSKQIAEKTPATIAEPTEIRPDEATINKEGIGGFIGSDDNGDVALLEQGFVETNVRETLGEVIVVDNDEAIAIDDTIAYEDLPTDEGKTRIKTGAQFPVVMTSQINSKNAKKGDTIQARLKYDLKIGDRLIAEKGSPVTGHLDYCMPARSVMHSLVSPNRWYRNSGCVGISFDEMINKKGEHLALNAKPAMKSRIVKNKAEGRLLGVNHDGQITGPWGQQLRYKAVRIGLNFALAPAGVFTFGAMPVALGVMGAVNPSFAFMKPVGTNVRHRRIKGFAWGFLSGIPGSWIIEDTVTKGQEAIIKPGDEFLVELHQEFTGEARSSAELLPGSSAKVSGQVVKDPKEKSKKFGKKK